MLVTISGKQLIDNFPIFFSRFALKQNQLDLHVVVKNNAWYKEMNPQPHSHEITKLTTEPQVQPTLPIITQLITTFQGLPTLIILMSDRDIFI